MTTKTPHKSDCNRIFKKYDQNCKRCIELINGAEPRQAWFTPRAHVPYSPKDCGHGSDNVNPGGYCNVCGSGRDHS